MKSLFAIFFKMCVALASPFSDKISPKLKSELSPYLGCHLPEKLECLRFHAFLKLQVFLHMLIKQVPLFITA
jgi:hypothetical protein